MKSFVALFALSALVNAVPEPQLQLNYPVVYSGLYNHHALPAINYQPMTRYSNGAIAPVEPYANQKAKLDHFQAKLDHFQAKAEEYQKKGYSPYVIRTIAKRDAEAEADPIFPYAVNYNPAVYNTVPAVYSHTPVVYNKPVVYNQPLAYHSPAVVTYKQEIDDVETPADTQKVSYTQKVVASPFYSGLGYNYPVYSKVEEKKSVEKRDAESQVLYPNVYNGVYDSGLYNHGVYSNLYNNLPVGYNGFNAFNPVVRPVVRPVVAY